MPNKPNGRQCINVTRNKTSYLQLRRKGGFELVANPAAPNVGEIIGAIVKDDDNGSFYFTPTVVDQVSPGHKRLALKLVSAIPAGAADPTEGLLSITMLIFTGPVTPPDQVPVADVPVDYISDPAGP